MKRLFIAALSILSTLSFYTARVFAAVDGNVEVTGTVISFDDKVVKVSNRGAVTLVPRKAAPKILKAGDLVDVTFDLEEFKKTLPAK